MELERLARRVEDIEARLKGVEEEVWGKDRLRPVDVGRRETGFVPPMVQTPAEVPPPLPVRAEVIEEVEGFEVVVRGEDVATFGVGPRRDPVPEYRMREEERDQRQRATLNTEHSTLNEEASGDGWEEAHDNGRERVSWEARIGRNLAGWVGAIVLVLGVGFFLKYAWEREWINPSPGARVGMVVLLGVGLAGVGERLLRRAMRGLAGVLYAAGVAVVMTGFFAASAYFQPAVMGQTSAALMVLLTAAGGIALALRADLVAVAVLSLIGAYLSPVVLAAAGDRSGVLMAYLMVLAATGWVLCLVRPGWGALRGFTFGAAFTGYAYWFASGGYRHRELAFAYLAVLFAGTLAEVFVSVQRAVARGDMKVEKVGAVLSLVNTLATAAGMYLLHHANQPLAGALALGMAGVMGMVAVATGSKALRYSGIVQAAALVTVAVPLMMSEFAINIAWAVMAVALAVVGRKLEIKWARVWGVVLWGLAVGKLVTLDLMSPGMRGVVVEMGNRPVSRWLLMAWGCAAAGHVLALLGKRGVKVDRVGTALAGIGTALFLLATALSWGIGSVWTLAALVWVVAMVGLRGQGGRIGYARHAWVVLALVAAKWLMVDGLGGMARGWEGGGGMPVVSLVCANAILMGGLFVRMRSLTKDGTARAMATWAVWAIGFALANFEVCRLVNAAGAGWSVEQLVTVKQVALCGLWAGVSMVVASLTRRPGWEVARGVAVTMFVAALARVVCFAADPAMREAFAQIGGRGVSGWLVMMAAMGLAAHLMGWLVAERRDSPDPAAGALGGLGTLVFMAGVIGTWGFSVATTLAGIAWVTPIALIGRRGVRLNYAYHAWALAGVLAMKWLIADGVVPMAAAFGDAARDGYLPVWNLPALCAVLLAGVIYYLGRTTEEGMELTADTPPRVLAGLCVVGMAFFLANFEVVRAVGFIADGTVREVAMAKQVALSILWAGTALAAVATGFARKAAAVRYAGLGLLGITLLKVFVVDMAGVETIWRILSFMAVGALLLCVSFVYYRHMEGKAMER